MRPAIHSQPHTRRGPASPAAVIALSLLILSGCTVRHMIYPAPPIPVSHPAPVPLEDVDLELAGGVRVAAWSYQPPELAAGRPAVLYFHGNGENLETLRMAGLLDRLIALEVAFLAVDYPGYGRSGGKPSESSLRETADAALTWLGRRYDARPRVACGWSLGAAVAVGLAAERGPELAALIAMSPWASLPEVAAAHFPAWMVRLALAERYDSLSVAGRVELPSLVIHGAGDRIIPAEQGRRLADALPGGRWLEIRGSGHNDLLARDTVWREIELFLGELD